MSNYVVVDCGDNITTTREVIEGLKAIGTPENLIETSTTPISLKGYYDSDQGQGNVVVRRDTLHKHLGRSTSNDIGFELVDGKYKLHISDTDRKWWSNKQPVFQQAAVAEKVVTTAKAQGYNVRKVKEGPNIRVKLVRGF